MVTLSLSLSLLLLWLCRCCWLCGCGPLLLYSYNFICILQRFDNNNEIVFIFRKILSGLWATICLLTTLSHIHFAFAPFPSSSLPLPSLLFAFSPFSGSFFVVVICYQFYWNSTSLLSVMGLGILLCFAFHVGKINTNHRHTDRQRDRQAHRYTHRHSMAFAAILCGGFSTLYIMPGVSIMLSIKQIKTKKKAIK